MAERCAHHPNTPASKACLGCLQSVCATCLSEGRQGYCQACVAQALAGMAPLASQSGELHASTRKVPTPSAAKGPAPGGHSGPSSAARGPQASPRMAPKGEAKAPEEDDFSRGYGSVQAPKPKRSAKNADEAELPPIKEASPRDPNMCFLHRDIRAAAKCITCNKAFCPVCLNSAGICGHCTNHNPEAQGILFSPNARGQAVLKEMAEKEAQKGFKTRHAVVLGVAVMGLLLGWKFWNKPEAKVDPTTAVFQKLRDNELSAAEKAQLALLHGQRRVEIASPPPPPPLPVVQAQPQGAWGAQISTGQGGGGARVGQNPSRTGGGSTTRAVRVGLLAPGTARGMVTVGASVSGQVGRVDFLVDGAFVDSRSGPPYRFSWATQAHGNGAHTLTVEARGEAGLLARASRQVTVAN